MNETIELNRRDVLTVGAGVGAMALMGSGTIPTSARAQTASDSVSGTVTDGDGNPVENAWVLLDPHASDGSPVGDTVLATQTDANGDYSFGSSDLYSGENYYHAYCRNGDDTDPQRAIENYPWILAGVEDDGIPDSGLLHARYDFTEEDGTIPISDQTGNGNDLDQGAYSGVSVTINGNQAGEFDGTDDIAQGAFATTVTQPNYTFVVAELQAPGSGNFEVLTDGEPGVNSQQSIQSNGDDNWRVIGDGSFTGSSDDGNPHVFEVEWNGTGSELVIDGTVDATGETNNNLAGFTLGNTGTAGAPGNWYIGEVLVYESEPDRSAVRTYLGDKWGITI